jgi:hypothetical protein
LLYSKGMLRRRYLATLVAAEAQKQASTAAALINIVFKPGLGSGF